MSDRTSPKSQSQTPERLQKIIAQAGIASRRDAEDLIREGEVTVNGRVAKLGDKATLGVDAIKVKGKLLVTTATKVYYVIYKPTTMIAMLTEDEEGRPTLKDLTSRIKERVFPVGRMDFTGEGAILLTNDGALTQQILKSNDIVRRYHVKIDRHPTTEDIARLARGGRIEGRSMNPYHVRVVNNYTRNSLIEISFEGMGSIDVRKYFENKGFFPEKVARVAIGHISVESLDPGTYKKLEGSSVKALLAQPELAKKKIENLSKEKTGGLRRVSDDSLKKDAERRRRGKRGFFETDHEAREQKVSGFITKGAKAPIGRGVRGSGNHNESSPARANKKIQIRFK